MRLQRHRPHSFFWALFVNALVTSQLRASLSLVFFIRGALILSLSYTLHVTSLLLVSSAMPVSRKRKEDL